MVGIIYLRKDNQSNSIINAFKIFLVGKRKRKEKGWNQIKHAPCLKIMCITFVKVGRQSVIRLTSD